MTARDMIAQTLIKEANRLAWATGGGDDSPTTHTTYYTTAILDALLSAPDSVRLELAAMLNPWRPIEDVPPELKDGRQILTLIPCYGAYLEAGQLRGYLYAIVAWKYGQWNEVGVGKREPAYFQELDPVPLAEEKE